MINLTDYEPSNDAVNAIVNWLSSEGRNVDNLGAEEAFRLYQECTDYFYNDYFKVLWFDYTGDPEWDVYITANFSIGSYWEQPMPMLSKTPLFISFNSDCSWNFDNRVSFAKYILRLAWQAEELKKELLWLIKWDFNDKNFYFVKSDKNEKDRKID